MIAPDHLGFGQSDSPTVDEFDYSFDSLARLTAGLLDQLGLQRYAIYVQDYGAPIGWRLALQPHGPVTPSSARTATATRPASSPTSGTRSGRTARTATRRPRRPCAQLWTVTPSSGSTPTACPTRALVSPDTWTLDHALLQRPGNDEVQLRLFHDYRTNRALYPRLQEHLRINRIPVLAVWGGTTRSSHRMGRQPSARTCPTPRCTSWTGGTSCWRPPSTRPQP